MKFLIITPTYNRLSQLQRNIKSIQDQHFDGFTHYIVDDSTNSDTEKWFFDVDLRNTVYIRNKKNFGSNFSKNYALDLIFSHTIYNNSYVIFLDDDDYMSPDALEKLEPAILRNAKHDWYVSRRVYTHGTSITQAKRGEGFYDYVSDYLLGTALSGDATHIIRADLVQDIRFSHDIKNGEEWTFFLQVARKSKIYFLSLATTCTDGYTVGGLTQLGNTLSFRRSMLLRMYNSVGRDFPDVRRWKVILGYFYYLPGIWHILFIARKLLGLFK